MTSPLLNPGDILTPHRGSAATAIVDLTRQAAPRMVSYGALDRGADAFARGLARAGFGRGARVGILAHNRVEYFEVFLGAMKAGAVPLPLNIRLADAVLAGLIAANDLDLLVGDADCVARVAGQVACPVIVFDGEGAGGYDAFKDDGIFDAVRLDPADVIMQPFTSGTTGLPRGIVLTAANVAWAYRQTMPPGRAPDPTVAATVAHPLYHKNAMLGSKHILMNGGRVVMMDRFVPALFADAIGRYAVTKVHTVPTMMAKLMAEPGLVAGIDQRSIREIHMGSAPVSRRLFDEIKAAFPKAYVRSSYGVTEAGPMQFGEHPEGVPRPPMSIGYPMREVQVRLVGGATPDEGVLLIKNPGVMKGYYKDPERTAARFDAEGWYVTGDILRRDAQGFYYFVGRGDDMFVVSGNNLYPATVEETLLKHPAVAAAAVIAVPDEIRGHVPWAYVVLRPGTVADEEEIKRFCLASAPPYQHPRRVRILPELPLAGTNKVDLRALRAMAAATGS